ncbi:MAG TPA: hypothetical protein VFZ25_15645 [Chloroflexota bacterium]|nr:hypothetical protein [Chloroflexota bacterium]
MSARVTPLVFVGGSRESAIEEVLADAHEAVALDTLERLLGCPEFDAPIVATGSRGLVRQLRDWPVRVVPDDGSFHFGRVLAGLIERFGVERAFYVGGGAAPLLSVEELSRVGQLVLTNERVLVANNFFSADFVAFTPADAIHRIAPPAIDNDLAFRLQREGGLRNLPLERTSGTQMDLDTPTDLLILSLHPNVGPNLGRFFGTADLDPSRIRQVSHFLTDPTAEVVVSGRVGSYLWAHLDTDLACRTRIFSEERGMRANGREARGEVRSLLAYQLQAVGPERFFEQLAELGNAAFIDSRVIFNHLKLDLTASDRFNSDLLRVEEVTDPMARAFTSAARDASKPVVLGGHSLVAGGLWALTEAAWLEQDRIAGR